MSIAMEEELRPLDSTPPMPRVVKVRGVGAGPKQATNIVHHLGDGLQWMTAATRSHLLRQRHLEHRFRAALEDATEVVLDEQKWQESTRRLLRRLSATVSDSIEEKLDAEIYLWLYLHPNTSLEYVGRGVVARQLTAQEQAALLFFDIPGGRRRYYFRVVEGLEQRSDDAQEFLDSLQGLKAWLDDPEARVVLSIGGGGFRLFAVGAALKMLDHLLGDRTKIAEVWGSSGGAIAGHVFADGHDSTALDELGWELYGRRDPSLDDGSIWSLAKLALSSKGSPDAPSPSTFDSWAAWLIRRSPDAERRVRLPHFSVATNPATRRVAALAEPRDIPESCRDFIFPCTRVQAIGASTAVPFVVRTRRWITGDGQDRWVDGSIIEEHPLSLPFAKWARERRASPETTPRRLKVLLVDLNLRASESAVVATLLKIPLFGTVVVKRIARILDLFLDSRMWSSIRVLTEIPDVEVRCLKLSIGRLGLQGRGVIGPVILAGRKRRSWRLISYDAASTH